MQRPSSHARELSARASEELHPMADIADWRADVAKPIDDARVNIPTATVPAVFVPSASENDVTGAKSTSVQPLSYQPTATETNAGTRTVSPDQSPHFQQTSTVSAMQTSVQSAAVPVPVTAKQKPIVSVGSVHASIPIPATLTPSQNHMPSPSLAPVVVIQPSTAVMSPAKKARRESMRAMSQVRITLTWENVSATLPPRRKKFSWLRRKPTAAEIAASQKLILNNVSGCVQPGQVIALMGASGAGKTTLMNFLNGRNHTQLKFTGSVRINGRPVSWKTLPVVSAFVQQHDLFIGTLTVYEHLRFQAFLRMGTDFTAAEREARVQQAMTELNLVKCRNTIIGIPGRLKGISGGEEKRLAFASEALTDPPLMFCDEPTSGLDSFMARNVVNSLNYLAKTKGKTILCVIHQPSSEAFELFDDVILMSEGRVAYQGSVKDALGFLGQSGFKCPPRYNPADFFITTLAIQYGKEAECLARAKQICDAYEASSAAVTVHAVIEGWKVKAHATHADLPAHGGVGGGKSIAPLEPAARVSAYVLDELDQLLAKSHGRPYKAGFFSQLRWVTWRSGLTTLREPMLFRAKFSQAIIMGLLLGLLYLKTGDRSVTELSDVQNYNGILLLLLMNISMANLFGVLNNFTAELPVFQREHSNGVYRVDAYFLSKTFVDLPMCVIPPIIQTTIIYWMAGLNSSFAIYLEICALLVLTANTAVSYAYCISCAVDSVDQALAVSAPLMICLLVFSGQFLNADSIPPYFYPFKYISWFKYAAEAINSAQWDSIDSVGCADPVPGSSIPICPYKNGTAVLNQYTYSISNTPTNVGALFGLLIGYRILAFTILFLKNLRKK